MVDQGAVTVGEHGVFAVVAAHAVEPVGGEVIAAARVLLLHGAVGDERQQFLIGGVEAGPVQLALHGVAHRAVDGVVLPLTDGPVMLILELGQARRTGGADRAAVDVVVNGAVVAGGDQRGPGILRQRRERVAVHLVNPGGPEIDRRVGPGGAGPGTAAETVARLQYGDLMATPGQLAGRGQTGDAGADHDDPLRAGGGAQTGPAGGRGRRHGGSPAGVFQQSATIHRVTLLSCACCRGYCCVAGKASSSG